MAKTERLCIFFVPVLACALWTVFAGKDLNWDLLNYHYYLPFELIAGRVEQDFYAASAQSYLNPLGYVPFYLMVASGWHSVVVSVLLAAVHSMSLALLYLLARRLFADLPERERTTFSMLAAALGGATPVFWATVGTSFLDPLLTPFMLAGLLLLLDAPAAPMRRTMLSGALFGAAAALKYSNAIYAVAALPLALPQLAWRARLRAGLGYAAGGALAVVLLAGPWLIVMAQDFGNPVFPLMNGWFHSPYAPQVNTVSDRFTPSSIGAALSLPFRMATLDRHLYSETFAPDIRLAALLGVGLALAVLAISRAQVRDALLRGPDWRMLGFLCISATLWIATSANARYGMIVLLLAGVALARLVERLLAAAAARIALVVLLVVQLGLSVFASPARWFIAEPWSRHWFPYDVPQKALREPALYLTLEILPMAVVAPFVHPASSFVNFRGQHSIPTDSPKLAALIARHRGHLRALGRGLLSSTGIPPSDQVRAYDATLRRIGYRLDTRNCFTIAWRPDDQDALSRAANRFTDASPSHEPLSVASCALLPARRDPAEARAEHRASRLFDRIERECPALFQGQTAVTEPLGSAWTRNYGDLDARLESYGDRVVLNRYGKAEVLDLGRLSDWQAGNHALPAACRRAD